MEDGRHRPTSSVQPLQPPRFWLARRFQRCGNGIVLNSALVGGVALDWQGMSFSQALHSCRNATKMHWDSALDIIGAVA